MNRESLADSVLYTYASRALYLVLPFLEALLGNKTVCQPIVLSSPKYLTHNVLSLIYGNTVHCTVLVDQQPLATVSQQVWRRLVCLSNMFNEKWECTLYQCDTFNAVNNIGQLTR